MSLHCHTNFLRTMNLINFFFFSYSAVSNQFQVNAVNYNYLFAGRAGYRGAEAGRRAAAAGSAERSVRRLGAQEIAVDRGIVGIRDFRTRGTGTTTLAAIARGVARQGLEGHAVYSHGARILARIAYKKIQVMKQFFGVFFFNFDRSETRNNSCILIFVTAHFAQIQNFSITIFYLKY